MFTSPAFFHLRSRKLYRGCASSVPPSLSPFKAIHNASRSFPRRSWLKTFTIIIINLNQWWCFYIRYLYLDGWAAEGRISARLKNVLSHRAVEERRISPRGRRTSYLTGRFKNDASRRADEERRICRAGEERRISPCGSRTTYLAVRVKNAVTHRAVQERRISRVFFSWNFVVAALGVCRGDVVCLNTLLINWDENY